MASSEHPQPSPQSIQTPAPTGIQTQAEAPSVPLPPLPHKPVQESVLFPRLRGWLDALLVLVVLVFAFLVASFPATNTDFFRQLATGRLIQSGQYHFGVDPFVYTAANDYFVNHSWLFALLMYGLYQLPSGGTVVVIFKALLSVALAEVLLRAGRRVGQSLWIPAVCTALAILVVSPRLHLQPTFLSFLFLGVTVWILTAVGTGRRRLLWLLPPLFALWANCDSWFFLGPLTVALYLVGEFFPAVPASRRVYPSGSNAMGWLALAVGVAACFINPHHYHAFTLPPGFDLTPAGGLLEHDPQFRVLFFTPFSKEYYLPYLALSVAGLAYWPLLLLGLLSFVFLFAFGQASWPRLLVWSGFALLSLYNIRVIPFFAIVAGPITSLNWLDLAAHRLGTAPRLTRAWRNWSLGGRAVTLLLGLVLLIATVPGWLQRSVPHFRRIGWSVQPDPSLQALAQTIRGWSEAGLLPQEPHWFNMQHEIADYLAWFAPGQRVFLDNHLPYFRDAALDYLDIRKGIEQLVAEQPEEERDAVVLKTDWRKVLRKNEVHFWIYDNLSSNKVDKISQWLLFTHPQEWVLCHLQGRIAVFAWRDPQKPDTDPSSGLALDIERAAFGSAAEPAPPRGAEPAPLREWWNVLWDAWRQPNPPPTSDREVIQLYNFRYQAVERPEQIHKYSRIWQRAIAAGAVAQALPHGPVPSSLLALSWSSTYHDLFPPGAMQPTRPPRPYEEAAMQVWAAFVGNQFIGPPSLYLAIRAARRALVVNPEDENTYFRLGQIYQRLQDLPQEQTLRAAVPRLAAIRRTQLAAAYQNCLRLQPDDESAAQAHAALFDLYLNQLGYIDAAVHHLRQALEKRTALGPLPGETATRHNQELDRMSAELTRLDGELERRLNRYEVNAAAKTGFEKVKVALELGLSETALATLEQVANPDVRTQEDLLIIKQATEVILDLGRLDRARELLPDLQGKPVKPDEVSAYVRLAAARGDYAEADRILDDALRHTWQTTTGEIPIGNPALGVAESIGRVLLAEAGTAMNVPRFPLLHPLLPSNFFIRRWRMEAIREGLLAVGQQVEWYLMRGWLALEAGHCDEARRLLQAARDVAVPGSHWIPEFNRLNAWLDPQNEIPRMQQLGFRQGILHELSKHYLKWLE